MQEKKIVFILPAFAAKPDRPEYQQVGGFYEQKGFEPVFVELRWNKKKPLASQEAFQRQYFLTQADKKYIFGFSVGAQLGFHLAALDFTAAHGSRPEHLLLCSPSAYFKEDLDMFRAKRGRGLPDLWAEEINRFEWSKMVYQIQGSVSLVVGGEEQKEPFRSVAFARMQQTLTALRTQQKEMIVIPGVEHDLADPRYLATVERIIAKLG